MVASKTLTEVALRSLKPSEKPYRRSAGSGLFVEVQPGGSKLWRLAYRFERKQKLLALGSYPLVGLAEARRRRDAARQQIEAGIDPSAERAAAKQMARLGGTGGLFETVAEAWFASRRRRWTEGYAQRVWARIKADAVDRWTGRAVDSIRRKDVLEALRAIEGRGAVVLAKRVKQHLRDLFAFAKGEGLVVDNPVDDDITAALQTAPAPKRRSALKATDLPEFFIKLAQYDGDPTTRAALHLTIQTAVRTGETRFANASEFHDLDGSAPLWRIPPERMKVTEGRGEHLVPLARQTVALVKPLIAAAPASGLLFPGLRGDGMSENTMLYALYRLGYHSRATVHGFRGTFSTVLNEHGFNEDWIELQLAHIEENTVRAAYNSAQYLDGRRTMMQWWADYLDRQAEAGRLL